MKDLRILSSLSGRAFALMPRSIQNSFTKFQEESIPLIQSNAELSTLLTIGMCVQTLAFLVLPYYVAATPAILYLLYKALYCLPSTIADNQYLNGVRLGRWSASAPNDDGRRPEKAGANGVVCFVVGTQVNQ